MVQYEGFHVFKVCQGMTSVMAWLLTHISQIFAANPNKSYEVQKFLIMNKQRLLKFLPNFLADRTDDDQFNDEKAWLVKAIGNLPDTTAALTPPSSTPMQQQQQPQTQVRS